MGLPFCLENPLKKNSPSILYGKYIVTFSKNHKLETIFEKSHRSNVILKIVRVTPQLVQNLTPIRKLFCTFLYQFFYYPRHPLQHIRKQKKFKDQKITSLFSLFTSTERRGR